MQPLHRLLFNYVALSMALKSQYVKCYRGHHMYRVTMSFCIWLIRSCCTIVAASSHTATATTHAHAPTRSQSVTAIAMSLAAPGNTEHEESQ